MNYGKARLFTSSFWNHIKITRSWIRSGHGRVSPHAPRAYRLCVRGVVACQGVTHHSLQLKLSSLRNFTFTDKFWHSVRYNRFVESSLLCVSCWQTLYFKICSQVNNMPSLHSSGPSLVASVFISAHMIKRIVSHRSSRDICKMIHQIQKTSQATSGSGRKGVQEPAPPPTPRFGGPSYTI